MRNKTEIISLRPKSRETGFTLIFVLALLSIIAILVIASSRATNTEMRVSANEADRKFAISLAEQALHQAEEQASKLIPKLLPGEFFSNCGSLAGEAQTKCNASAILYAGLSTDLKARLNNHDYSAYYGEGFTKLDVFKEGCTGSYSTLGITAGLCLPSPVKSNTDVTGGSELPAWERADIFTADENKTPNSTAAANIAGLADAAQAPRYIIEFLGRDKEGVSKMRITVRAWGKNPNTSVTLQSYIDVFL